VYDPRSKGAESYIRLAKELIERQPSAISSQPSAETVSTEIAEPVEEIAAAVDAMDKSA